MQAQFAARPEREKTDDLLSVRLAEELRLVARMLDLLEDQATAKGDTAAARNLHDAEEAVEDVAEVIEADDRCEAVEDVGSDMARRLLRRSLDGETGPCDKRRPSILRKVD